MNYQPSRNLKAIRQALTEVDGLTFQELSQRTGNLESLWTSLKAMLVHGEVEKMQHHSRAPIYYRLKI